MRERERDKRLTKLNSVYCDGIILLSEDLGFGESLKNFKQKNDVMTLFVNSKKSGG